MAAIDALAGAGTARYEVTGVLGSGGMGAVYRAFDAHDGHYVALKRLTLSPHETRRPLLIELFHQEFRTLARLVHPHVVRAFDFGVDATGPYYTMELIDGASLQLMAPLPWRLACSILRDIGSATALLHSRRLLHRDISPRNVLRTQLGEAKLIDFGAMMPMGPSQSLVGTPPYVPPEASMQQPLDDRADLFALGGTLYYALTGKHAYPARTFAQLPEVWRGTLVPPSRHVADVPRELDALVLSLLNLDPQARPRSAAEVIARLTAIADLPRDDRAAVTRAYVATPELVGRTPQLKRIRSRIGRMLRQRGGVLTIEGDPGSGRSRMLDTTVLEAKLSGVTVARANDAYAGTFYGTVGALLRRLFDALPEGQLDPLLQDRALTALRSGTVDAKTDAARRPQLQAALIKLLETMQVAQPLLLAIDDYDRCDEPSQAALASAAEACGHLRVLIALTTSGAVEAHGPLMLLREFGTQVELGKFSLSDTEALLGSVFGDVPYLKTVATRLHERAEGNPRACMALAQHLVDSGRVHYHMGSWRLPKLSDDGLPRTLSAARQIKLEQLSADARELAEALAVADGSALELDAFSELTPHRDRERVRAALEELLLAQIVKRSGEHYGFEARVWIEELMAVLRPGQLRQISRRVADALAQRDADRLEIARYLWRAGDRPRAIDAILSELKTASRRDRAPRHYAELLQEAADACLELKRSPRERFLLLHELVKVGHDLDLPDMRERIVALFTQLRRDSGLDDWEKLDPGLQPLPRTQLALELTKKRNEATPELERGLHPYEAIVGITRLVGDVVTIAAQTADSSLFDLLPALHAFFPLSPAIERIERLSVAAGRAIVAGRYELALDAYNESLISLHTSQDVDEELRLWGLRALHYGLGCIEAALGREQTLAHAAELDSDPHWHVPAWSVRRIYHLVLGDLREAERCRKRIELLLIQSPIKPPLYAGAAQQHVFACVMAESLTGMRQAIEEMETLSRAHPTLTAFLPFTHASIARSCGNFAEALALYDQTLETVRPGEHPLWAWAIGGRATALIGLGREEEAARFARESRVVAQEIGLGLIGHHIEIALALAEAKLGDPRGACDRLDQVCAARETLGMAGTGLGWAFESRARVAAWMGDAESFARYAQRCAQQYKKAEGDPALGAKYERLIQDARALGLSLSPELARAVSSETTGVDTVDTAISDAAGPLAVTLDRS